MNLPKLAAMFAKAAGRSRESDDWVDAKRDFEAEIDGVACVMRCRVRVIVSPEGRPRHVTGEVIAQVLAVGGERVEALCGWIHFSARDGAVNDPGPLFQLAVAEAAANVRRDASFRARFERGELLHAVVEAPSRARLRL